MAKHALNNRFKKLFAFATSAFLSVALFVPLSSAPANAAEFDVNFQAMSFNESNQDRVLYRGYPSSGTTTNIAAGSNAGTAGELAGDRVLYKNVITINGTAIDAVVKTVAIGANTTIDAFDGGSAVNNAPALLQTNLTQGASNETVTFTFTFYVAGSYNPTSDSGTAAILKNVLVNSYDLDDSTGGSRQFSEMTGFQSYRLASNTTLTVSATAGVTRFRDNTSANNTNYGASSGSYTQGRVQVRFDYLSTFTISHGVDSLGNGGTSYFALDFGPGFTDPNDVTKWPEGSTYFTTASTPNSAGNRPPTSTNTTLYVSTTSARVLDLADFGSYSDPDSNPFVRVRIDAIPATGTLEYYTNSAWVTVANNAVIPSSDIDAGYLRYTHNSLSNDTITFSVNDGLAYSAATYTITFIPTAQTQTVTFNNPGSKTPSQTIASGATADSGLTVTLTSNTPGICTVSGLNIVILANTGNCSITATQNGNSTYAAANSVTQVFSVTNSVTNYTITYAGNSPDSGSVPSSQTGNGSVTLASNSGNMVKSGFTFGGWTIGGQTYAAGASYNLASNVTATAIWTSNSTYTITYDGNSPDSGAAPSSQTGSGSVTLASNSGNLVKSGFTFGGWTIGGTSYSAGGSYNLSSNVTAVAIWNAVVVTPPAPAPMVYSLTFLAPTANQGVTPPVMVGTAAVIPGNIGNLTRPGYVFKGWTIDGVDYNSGVLVTLTSNRIAYAYWVPKVITFVDSSSGIVFAQPIEGSDQVKLPTADQVTKSGYVLVGWLIDDKKYEPGAVISIDAVENATALWTEYLSVPVTPEQEQATEESQETVLAATGISGSLWLGVASMLLAAGVVLMRLARRRV